MSVLSRLVFRGQAILSGGAYQQIARFRNEAGRTQMAVLWDPDPTEDSHIPVNQESRVMVQPMNLRVRDP